MKKLILPLLIIFTIQSTAQNLNSGLVVHYDFDQKAEDATLSNNHLTGSNINSYIPFFQNDSAYYLNGSNRLAQVNNFNNAGFTSTSVSMWIKPEVGPTYSGTMIQASYAGFAVYIEHNTGRVGAFFSSNSATTLVSTPNLLDSNWHHVVALNTGTETKIYIDGVFNVSKNQALVISGGSASQKRIHIGATNLNLHFYKGGLNDLRVYNRVLSQAEITALATFPTVTGILEKNPTNKVQLNLYPNPTNGLIYINSKINLTNSNVSLKNILGQTIQQETLNGNKNQAISIDAVDGVYFIEIVTPTNQRIVKKIIKK